MVTLDLDQLMEAPNLKLLMQQAEVALRSEERQRQAYYEWIHEDQKAEFINSRQPKRKSNTGLRLVICIAY
ncbi:hypothetical protein WBJ53_25630 [Spirosoma sp. SC4-14]|uniref:hypothetical protein n=1 Tax=Spirosoma sp. SC4-14 TaxID=3128900 RepID=UPI0030CDB813